MGRREADFDPRTRKIIGERSGYRCAYLGCDKVTVGPSNVSERATNDSRICHIYAAEDGGPRGTGGLSVEKRKSTSNGILMCSTHAELIDKNRGFDYPANLLVSWKHFHEIKIGCELKAGVKDSKLGWISSVKIVRAPFFKNHEKLYLGKVTLVSGDEGVGKTAFFEWITSVMKDPSDLNRWSERAREEDIIFEVEYYSEEHRVVSCKYDGSNLKISDGATECVSLDGKFKCIYIKEQLGDPVSAEADHVVGIAKILGIHHYQVLSLVESLDKEGVGFQFGMEVREEHLDDEDPSKGKSRRLYTSIGSHKSRYSYNQLSGREQSQVVMAFVVRYAEIYSRSVPTLLVLELESQFLPDGLIEVYTKLLTEPRFKFQTVFISRVDQGHLEWSGWSGVYFKENRGHVEIQNCSPMLNSSEIEFEKDTDLTWNYDKEHVFHDIKEEFDLNVKFKEKLDSGYEWFKAISPNDRVVGYCWTNDDDEGIEVSIVIEPKYRGRGIGKAFLDFIENFKKEDTEKFLAVVRAKNTNREKILNWLKSCGYEALSADENVLWDNGYDVTLTKESK